MDGDKDRRSLGICRQRIHRQKRQGQCCITVGRSTERADKATTVGRWRRERVVVRAMSVRHGHHIGKQHPNQGPLIAVSCRMEFAEHGRRR